MRNRTHTNPAEHARGFTIIELLVVMLIITIVIAIVLPALGGARNVAKNAATKTLANDFMNASARFQQDNNRLPGYFSAAEMGDDDNPSMAGLSAMENAMLDLAGGIDDGSGPANFADPNVARTISPLGPSDPNAIIVRVDLIGSDEAGAAYFTPPKKFYVIQGATSQQAPNTEILKIPDVVDAFGQPLLLWTRDESFSGNARMPSEGPSNTEVAFVRESSSDGPALFYWNANACFLDSVSLGAKGEDQTTSSLNPSLIGGGTTPADLEDSLAGILGHPGYKGNYDPDTQNLTDPATLQTIVAEAPRGSLVLHSAGKDGVFLSNKQAGKAIPSGAGNALHFGYNFVGGTTDDVSEAFDDMIFSGGN